MRALALAALLSLATAACATTPDAPDPDAPRAMTPEFLLRRDALLVTQDSRATRVIGQTRADLNGDGTQELILHLQDPAPDDAWHRRVLVYTMQDSSKPRRLLPDIVLPERFEPGYIQVVDLDGDGARELLVVGDTDEVRPATLGLYVRRDDALVELTQLPALGVDYVLDDLDGDGRFELITLRPDPIRPDKAIRLDVIVRERGVWRQLPPSRPIEDWLPGLPAKLLSSELGHPRMSLVIRLLFTALRERGLELAQPDLTQQLLEARLNDPAHSAHQSRWIEAMAWAGNARGARLMREQWPARRGLTTRGQMARTIAIAGTSADRDWLLTTIAQELPQHASASAVELDLFLLLTRVGFEAASDVRFDALLQRMATDANTAPALREAIGRVQ